MIKEDVGSGSLKCSTTRWKKASSRAFLEARHEVSLRGSGHGLSDGDVLMGGEPIQLRSHTCG